MYMGHTMDRAVALNAAFSFPRVMGAVIWCAFIVTMTLIGTKHMPSCLHSAIFLNEIFIFGGNTD
jgi:hypothetical protein